MRLAWVSLLSSTLVCAVAAHVAAPSFCAPLDLDQLARLRLAVERARSALLSRLPQMPNFGVLGGSTTRPPMLDAAAVDRFLDDATQADGWEPVLSKGGYSIMKRKVPGSPHVEVRGHGVFSSSPASVIALFESSDADFIRRYNPLYDSGRDLERYDGATKAAYARVRAAFPGVRPRDTVSLISRRSVRGDGIAFFQKAMEHRDATPTRGVVRAKILRGMFLMEPVAGSPGQTNFTFTQQCDAGGVVPAWIMNRLITGESLNFLARLERTARGSG